MRKYSPLKPDHIVVGQKCPVCMARFVAGDELTLVPTWPSSIEEAERAQAGHAYTREAQAVHWECRGR